MDTNDILKIPHWALCVTKSEDHNWISTYLLIGTFWNRLDFQTLSRFIVSPAWEDQTVQVIFITNEYGKHLASCLVFGLS